MTVFGAVFFFVSAIFTGTAALHAQQYNAVPLDHGVYGVIEHAALRGIIRSPPSAKPWQEHTVQALLPVILVAGLRYRIKSKRRQIQQKE
ncbi:MAG: hypothetical protein LBU28_05630 [Spirochaetaceae bacterium]|nr:hypothetical protein [Spirochaetaceae bacterium]